MKTKHFKLAVLLLAVLILFCSVSCNNAGKGDEGDTSGESLTEKVTEKVTEKLEEKVSERGTEPEREEMEAKQKEILDNLGIKR